jgi:hypothetical protein
MWKNGLRKSGLYDKDPNTGRITRTVHSLRKFFRTNGGWSNPDVAECLMGHQQGLNRIYAQVSQVERLLVEGYKEAEPNLTIDQQQVFEAPTGEITELKNWNTQLRLEALEGKEERRHLSDKISNLSKIIEKFSVNMGRMASDIERLTELLPPAQREAFESEPER